LHWALVTGACSGIGLEIARDLASRSYSLVMVSDRAHELELAAKALSVEHKVQTRAIVADLSRAEAASELYEQLAELDLRIDILVSNAGILLFGELADTDPFQANRILQLHVTTPTLLALYFGRDMRARGQGHVLFVSSACTWSDFPGITLYGSTKRYLRSLAAALRAEIGPWGVNVTCLAPGAVSTGLYGDSEGAAARGAKLGLFSQPSSVARKALRGMFRGKALVLPGAGAKLVAAVAALTPRWVIRMVRSHTRLLPRP